MIFAEGCLDAPLLAEVPDSEPRMSPRILRSLAYQLAAEPESATTIAFSGIRCDSSHTTRIGLTGSADSIAWLSIVSHRGHSS